MARRQIDSLAPTTPQRADNTRQATRSPIWHPFTQHALQPEAIAIRRTEGAWLESVDGRRILDAISSWWVVTHGHRHPRIMTAIREATETLDQVIFAGFTHEPAEEVARGLVNLVNAKLDPAGTSLDHVFFSDSGSTSVEVAIKMALGRWHNIGFPERRSIVALEHAYHGDTVGTMSTGARGVFSAAYEPLLFDVRRIPFPEEGREQVTYDALERACDGEAAALILEPLVLGAGGMLTYREHVLAEMVRIARRSGLIIIADEVMTGWGRTGSLLACERARVSPDILCLSKGITGGALPLAVTMCSTDIFDAYFSEDRTKTFFHSSSYTANPIACAAAAANLEIWSTEPVEARIAGICDAQTSAIARFKDDRRFSSVRRSGTITALDLEVRDKGYLAEVGPRLYAFFLERGVLLRPLGNTIYVMPPYCTTREEIDLIYRVIGEAADALG